MKPRPGLKIVLTAEQRQQIEQSTGKQVKVVELKLESLECRATPRIALN